MSNNTFRTAKKGWMWASPAEADRLVHAIRGQAGKDRPSGVQTAACGVSRIFGAFFGNVGLGEFNTKTGERVICEACIQRASKR